MKERPILFKGEMVRAILECRKTMTRRIVKNGAVRWCPVVVGEYGGWETMHGKPAPCPYGVPGDRLWVKETWAEFPSRSDFIYSADEIFDKPVGDDPRALRDRLVWRSPLFMPRHASRITLEIVSAKVERLNDITEEDAEKEGCQDEVGWCSYCRGTGTRPYGDPCDCDGPGERIITTALERFEGLWDSINGKTPGASWRDNPWVWVIEFKRVTK